MSIVEHTETKLPVDRNGVVVDQILHVYRETKEDVDDRFGVGYQLEQSADCDLYEQDPKYIQPLKLQEPNVACASQLRDGDNLTLIIDSKKVFIYREGEDIFIRKQ